MSKESSGRPIVVASDWVLLADVLCTALSDRGLTTMRWSPDLDSSAEHVGLVLVDPEVQTSRAYAERVLGASGSCWVMIAATPPPTAWLDTLVPSPVEVVGSSAPLAHLAATLHELAYDEARERSTVH